MLHGMAIGVARVIVLLALLLPTDLLRAQITARAIVVVVVAGVAKIELWA